MKRKDSQGSNGKEKDEFTLHLERSAKIVDEWPEWKQRIMTKSSMTAQTRRKKN
ncbi:MAG: hypothetical protein R6V10_10350 [bacterium]